MTPRHALRRGTLQLHQDEDEVDGGAPDQKETRAVWWRNGFDETRIYEQDDVLAGHAIETRRSSSRRPTRSRSRRGRTARMDRNGIWHLPSGGGG